MTMMKMESYHSRSYEELISFKSFEERLNYLLLHGVVCEDTFGFERYLNQILYKCPEWRSVRKDIIVRDQACNLAFPGFEIYKYVIVHHINPITVEDILERRPIVFDPNNLITTNLATHNIIHYGSINDLANFFVADRTPNDTCPWRK